MSLSMVRGPLGSDPAGHFSAPMPEGGVIYVEPDKDDFITQLNLVDTPLAALPMERTRPSQAVLDEVMESLR